MTLKRMVIAATGSGSGKTTITCGLLGALKDKGLKPCSFKCGPDYIDPMFHRKVLDIPAGNLDTFFTEDELTRKLFAEEYSGDIAVIEGVMGLYDGLGGVEAIGSTYDLARVLQAPIILVVNGRGKGRSLLAEIKGFLDFDTNHLIKGVILNKVSEGFGSKLGALIEEELGIKYIGFVENNNDLTVDSRHLGLVLPEEIEDIKLKQTEIKQLVSKGLDLDLIVDIASAVQNIEESGESNRNTVKTSEDDIVNAKSLKLAVARDEAFCFYYRENLKLLEEAGVELVYFSPLRDSSLPKGCSGLLLGGGYPENYLKELSANTSMKQAINKAINDGIPVMAECGGFMYLLDSIADKEGNSYPMVGAIKGVATWTGKLVRFGYVTINLDKDMMVKGHEFHYYDTDNNGEDMVVTKSSTGKSYNAMHRINGGFVGFPHLYYPSAPEVVSDFVEVMKNYGKILN